MVLVATQVKRRRGTNNENDAFAGAEGEITVDLTNKELRVHDGSGKKGGFRVGHYSYSSNCITEIPQDINLVLSNGTLILKAGSKVYVPNGAGVFNTITTASDLTTTYSGSDILVVYLRKDGTGLSFSSLASTVSGETDSLAGTTYHNWYDTTNNVIHRYTSNASTPNHDCSLPLCIVTASGGAISSIGQIFNGFGYIGSTIFALPNVKGLIPNGRNIDGTLKNTKFSISSVITRTFTTAYSGEYDIFTGGTVFGALKNTYVYDEQLNYNLDTGNQYNNTHIGRLYMTSGVISKFSIKTVFHMLDYNDSEYIAKCAMPSDKYIDLTLGVSGTSYTAPADGYFSAYSVNTGNIALYNTTENLGNSSPVISQVGSFVSCPARKGENVLCVYTGSTIYLKFVYAQGSK